MESRRETSVTAVIHHPGKCAGLRSTPDCPKEIRVFRLLCFKEESVHIQELWEYKSSQANDFVCRKLIYNYPCKIVLNWENQTITA
jgi:hypothetical protein